MHAARERGIPQGVWCGAAHSEVKASNAERKERRYRGKSKNKLPYLSDSIHHSARAIRGKTNKVLRERLWVVGVLGQEGEPSERQLRTNARRKKTEGKNKGSAEKGGCCRYNERRGATTGGQGRRQRTAVRNWTSRSSHRVSAEMDGREDRARERGLGLQLLVSKIVGEAACPKPLQRGILMRLLCPCTDVSRRHAIF